jgi:hypothetical protein
MAVAATVIHRSSLPLPSLVCSERSMVILLCASGRVVFPKCRYPTLWDYLKSDWQLASDH